MLRDSTQTLFTDPNLCSSTTSVYEWCLYVDFDAAIRNTLPPRGLAFIQMYVFLQLWHICVHKLLYHLCFTSTDLFGQRTNFLFCVNRASDYSLIKDYTQMCDPFYWSKPSPCCPPACSLQRTDALTLTTLVNYAHIFVVYSVCRK